MKDRTDRLGSVSESASWLLAIAASLLGFFIGAILGVAGSFLIETYCIPEDSIDPNDCDGGWIQILKKVLGPGSAAISAFCMVLFPALVLPTEKRLVAFLALVIGCNIAFLLAVPFGGHWQEFFSALVAGGIAFWLVMRLPQPEEQGEEG